METGGRTGQARQQLPEALGPRAPASTGGLTSAPHSPPERGTPEVAVLSDPGADNTPEDKCQPSAKAEITEPGGHQLCVHHSSKGPTDSGALPQPLPQGRFWLTFPSPPTQACRKVSSQALPWELP